MVYAPSLAAAAETSDSGNAFVGFLMIIGIIWFFAWLFSSKPKGYTLNTHTTGTIKRN